MEPTRAVLFDMDGTLVDTHDLIYESFNKALHELNKKPLSKEDFTYKLFGKPVDSSVYSLVGISSDREYHQLMAFFESAWIKNLKKLKVLKDVPLTLRRLREKGRKLGVVSTSPRNIVAKTLEVAGIRSYFDVIIGGDDARNKKPHHEPVTNALKILGVAAKNAIYVGDTIYDVQAGRSAGCYTVFLLNSYNRDNSTRAHPDRAIEKVSELLDIIK